MQSNSRILVNLLAKPTRTPIGIYRGGHGGANPPTSLSQAVFPHKRGCLVPGLLTWEPDPRGKPKGQPSGCFWGVSPGVILPRWPPLVLGLLGFARSTPSRFVADFYRFFQTFLGVYSSHSRVLFTSTTSCRTFRGEVDSSIPRVFGGL